MRGVKFEMTDVEAKALDTFGEAILAANSVDEWAHCSYGTPYYFAENALMVALTDLFGVDAAKAIRDRTLENGESVSWNVRRYFAEQQEWQAQP